MTATIRLKNVDGVFVIRSDVYTLIKDTTLIVDEESETILGRLENGTPMRRLEDESTYGLRVAPEVDHQSSSDINVSGSQTGSSMESSSARQNPLTHLPL